jgi:hypothetical protein
MRVNKINTLLRGVYTLGLCLILSQLALAQPGQPIRSELNFLKATVGGDQSNVGFAVTNPTPNYADVQFTLYGFDGNPVSSGLVVNPVRVRVAPRGQISRSASDLFAASAVDGWVQATSSTAGLTGSYLVGDFVKTLEGSAPAAELSTQVVPLLRQDANNDTTLVVVNPSSSGNSTVNIAFYNSGGQQVGIANVTIPPHAAQRLALSSFSNLPADNLSARIVSSIPVAATSLVKRSNGVLFASGQPVDQPTTLRMASHFLSGKGFDSVLVLTNPNNSAVSVTLTLIGKDGGAIDPSLQGPTATTFTIPPNGSISKNTSDIVGRQFVIPLTIDGWLRIESPSPAALDGVLVLDETTTVCSIPLQTNPQNQIVYSEIFENASTVAGLALVNSSAAAANVDLFLLQSDGTTVSQKTIPVPANSKFTTLVHDQLPDVVNQTGSYVFVRSSVPIYSTAFLFSGTTFLTNVAPGAVPAAGYVPDTAGTTPRIRLESSGDVRSNSIIQVTLLSAVSSDDAVFTIGSQIVPILTRSSAIGGTFDLQLPSLEPGFVYLRVHANGADSPPVALRVRPDNSPIQNISGTALYQKIDVTDSGLDLGHPVMFPIRNARVEVLNSISQLVSVSETDAFGRFTLAVPFDPNLTVQVLSQIRSFNLRVADNTSRNALYAIQAKVDGTAGSSSLVLTDNNRQSGAFNILEVIQRANDTVRTADSNLPPIPVTVFWSTRNTHTLGNPALGQIGTSEFNVASNTAYILGDRDTDSDEYDDAVIAHEYAHMMATKYSRDDSPGGIHILGDMLDPRVAWSEGWANFFSSAVRNDPIWRDSHGPNGAQILRYDLSDNSSAADPHPGYWSEASVQSLLWSLLADPENPYPFSAIWGSFADLTNDRWVYLPYFLDHFINRIPASTKEVLGLAQARSIDYQPGGVPSVALPFPTQMTVGSTVGGYVDSYSTRRTNLMTSSHFYTFTTTGGDATIMMRITGLGPGNNPNNNDLDIFLYDINGRMIDKSDTALNGQPERISDKLPSNPAGTTYVVEVRSYYTKGETGNPVYNSGDYKLSVSVQ